MRPGRQTRSFGYEQYPPRPSKKVRTAVGRQIYLAGHISDAQKHRLERCRQQLAVPGKGKRKTRRAEPAGQICHIGLSAGPKPRALVTYHLNRLNVRPGAGGCASGPIGAGARASPAPRPTHEKGGSVSVGNFPPLTAGRAVPVPVVCLAQSREWTP